MRVTTIDESSLDDFVELAWRMNAGDPRWIPPMRVRLRQELSGADAFGRYGRMRQFGCHDGSKLLGGLAALINPRITDANGQPIGQVGYFESVDNPQVATRLFDAAFAWLRSEGAKEAVGPMNGGAHRLHRLMTSGFEHEPFLFEPRNPAYYPQLFEAGGFARRHLWRSYDVPSGQFVRALDTLGMFRINDRVLKRYAVSRLDVSDPMRVVHRMHALLDRLWAGHVGYAPLDEAEFAEVFVPPLTLMDAGDLLALVDREGGNDVGYIFSYPDFGAQVRALEGDASRWGAWRAENVRPRRLVMHTLAVIPEARGTGAASWLLRRIIEHCVDDGYETGVMALGSEDLRALARIAPPTREYVLFGRRID